ncbi:MAG: lipoprotein [Betaproteobacteria bacterium]|nr:lipoprotein [Betaproteobacteria bacterium]
MLLIVLAAVVTACGYKGPLYLPKPKPEAQQPAPAATPEEKKNDSSRQ